MGHKRLVPARLGEKLKAIREHLELTAEQLIERLDCPLIVLNKGHIDKYEKNLRAPPTIILLRYARLAGISLEDLAEDAVDLELK